MTEQNEQLIPHKQAAKTLLVAALRLEEGIRNGIIPFIHYTTEPYGKNSVKETWWLTSKQVEEAGIALRAQKYNELQVPSETRLGVRRRVYNYSLRTARLRLGLTAEQLGKRVGINLQIILKYENLRAYPPPERAQAIAGALGVSVESIFAPWLSEFQLQNGPSILDDAHFSLQEAFAAGIQLSSLASPEDDQIQELDKELLHERMAEVLADLPRREQRALALRFGLNGEEQHTLEQAGQKLEVNKERARQIEAQALRKLRHPRLAQRLRPFLA